MPNKTTYELFWNKYNLLTPVSSEMGQTMRTCIVYDIEFMLLFAGGIFAIQSRFLWCWQYPQIAITRNQFFPFNF